MIIFLDINILTLDMITSAANNWMQFILYCKQQLMQNYYKNIQEITPSPPRATKILKKTYKPNKTKQLIVMTF
jgi:hypothetical protein